MSVAQALLGMVAIVQYQLSRCAICRSHEETPIRVCFLWGPICICCWFHLAEDGTIEDIHTGSLVYGSRVSLVPL